MQHDLVHLHARRMSAYVSIRQHTSAFVSIRQHTSAYVRIRPHTSAYVSIRQHTSAYVRIRPHTSAYVSIRQHTSAYVSIRQPSVSADLRTYQHIWRLKRQWGGGGWCVGGGVTLWQGEEPPFAHGTRGGGW